MKSNATRNQWAARSMAIVMLAGLCAVPVLAQRYVAEDITFSAQPQHDIDQGRPDINATDMESGTMNGSGDIVGFGFCGPVYTDAYKRPYFYDASTGKMANLGDLSGDFGHEDGNTPGYHGTSYARGINEAGWVVGTSFLGVQGSSSTEDNRAFLWIDADGNGARTMTPFDEMFELPPNPNSVWAKARDINDLNQVVIIGESGIYRAQFEFDPNGALNEVGTRLLISEETGFWQGIGPNGEIWWNLPATTSGEGYIWRDLNDNGQVDPNETSTLPVAYPGSRTWTSGMNAQGQVFGTMKTGLKKVAFVWTDLDGDNQMDWDDTNPNGYFEASETSDEVVRFTGNNSDIFNALGNTFPQQLNNLGEAIGAVAGYPESGARFAWIWDAANGARFLDDLLIDPNFVVDNLKQAEGLSDLGEVAVSGMNTTTEEEYLVYLKPVHALTLTYVNPNYGSVEMTPEADPNLADPNDPNTPAYAVRTEVTLTAVPVEGKSFNRWLIFDPNYPGDANYATEDTNTVTTVLMMADHQVEAQFKCGSSLGPMLPMLVLLTAAAIVPRLRRHRRS